MGFNRCVYMDVSIVCFSYDPFYVSVHVNIINLFEKHRRCRIMIWGNSNRKKYCDTILWHMPQRVF